MNSMVMTMTNIFDLVDKMMNCVNPTFLGTDNDGDEIWVCGGCPVCYGLEGEE